MKNSRMLWWFFFCYVVSGIAIACCKKKDLPKGDWTPGESKNILFTLPKYGVVHFSFDDANLSNAAIEQLAQNVVFLKEHPKIKVIVEGHCDDRGTIAYNMALGERRALAIENYYIHSGIEPGRVDHVSYGKEIPFCTEETEECWAVNRRGVTAAVK